MVGVEQDAIRLWDVRNQKELEPLSGQSSTAVAFSPDGQLLASAGFESEDVTDSIRIWDVPGHRLLGDPIEVPGGYIGDLEFSADGETLASAGNAKVIRLWDVDGPAAAQAPDRRHAGATSSTSASAERPKARLGRQRGGDPTLERANPRPDGSRAHGAQCRDRGVQPERADPRLRR